MTAIKIETLSEEAFAPFGRVLGRPAIPAQAEGPGWQWWGEIDALPNDGRRWTFGFLDLDTVPMTIDWAERHLRSPEVVFATAAPLALYVAPGGTDEPSLDALRAFEVPPGSGVVLDPSVWHGAPFALDGPTSALVLLLEGTGREDVTVVRFPDTAVSVERGPVDSYHSPSQVEE